jgi:TolB-like protein/Tfp pilus assembly protein PilF
MSKLLAELKRRNVFRVAGLYLVGAWLIVQVAETVLPTFDVPTWVLRAIIILLALGLVPSLILSWIFELTPQGLMRDEDRAPGRTAYSGVDRRLRRISDRLAQDPVSPVNTRRMDRAIIIGLLLALGYFGFDKFFLAGAHEASSAQTVAAPIHDLVAVLPFRNRSPRPEDSYFTEGIHDDLLTQLSKIAHFKVISRTSMMAYADSKLSIPEIARQLGAAVVLEGAVQRAGENVRITMQLIDGITDVHLWAETYDRKLTTETIFAIQADIANAVANAMKIALTPAEASALATGSTTSMPAYEAFLQGKLLAALDRATPERFAQALQQFDRAIELDPEFAEAYARKARTQLATYWFAYGDASYRDSAAGALKNAQRLAPDAIETVMAEAYMRYWGRRDYTGAEAILARLLEKSPDYAEAWYARALVARRDGRFEEAISAFEHALAIDPANTDTILELSNTLDGLGRWDEAAELFSRSSAWAKDMGLNSSETLMVHGDIEAAWAAVDGPNEFFAALPFRIALASRDPARIERALSPELWPKRLHSVPEYPETYALAQAEALLVADKKAEARKALLAIDARVRGQEQPYPGGWASSSAYFYYPCDLPGMLGDLESVRAAERDFLDNAPRDAWAEGSARLALAVAFARAGDADRALFHLEAMNASFGPVSFLSNAMTPGLDSLRDQPRYIALEQGYKTWLAERRRIGKKL